MSRRALAIAAGAVAALLVLFDVLPWRCPASLLGFPCPACGFSRAVRAGLVAGDARAAFALHPLWAPILVVGGAIVVAEAVSFARSGALADYAGRGTLHRAGLVLAAAMFVVWIARFLGAFGGPAPIR